MPERRQESIGHAAADDQQIDLGEQVAEQIELGRYLGAAHDRGNRSGRRLQHLRECVELVLHGAAGIGRQLAAEAFDRGMRAMRHRERVVHEDVAERGELIDEGGVVAFFPGVEARVLQAQDIARFHRIDRRHGRCADAIVGERHRPLEHVRNRRRQRLQRLGRIASLRTSEMGEQDHLAALVGDLADGRSDALDAGGVRDLAVLDRDVEIDAHQHALAAEVGLIERAEHDYRPGCAVSTDTIATVTSVIAGWRQISLPIATAVSTMRLEKPHSLSYHDITRTSVPSITLVWSMAKIDECGSWLKSLETLGASV